MFILVSLLWVQTVSDKIYLHLWKICENSIKSQKNLNIYLAIMLHLFPNIYSLQVTTRIGIWTVNGTAMKPERNTLIFKFQTQLTRECTLTVEPAWIFIIINDSIQLFLVIVKNLCQILFLIWNAQFWL